ncbi:unnamed protein product [Discula destructiva]
MHIQDAPSQSYEAISYVWGNPSPTDYMLVDGKVLQLTSSIAAALRRFRWTHRPRRLWADQICINQQDRVERSDQVQLMGGLYRDCDCVLVWLGCDRDSIRAASRLVDVLDALDDLFADPAEDLCRRVGDPDTGYDPFGRDSWDALYEFLYLPWFFRAWVPQEIGTDAPAQLFWGYSTIIWDRLYDTLDGLLSHGSPLVERHELQSMRACDLFKQFSRSYPSSRRFVDTLIEMRRLDTVATDPRDYIFAFLGHNSALVPSIPDTEGQTTIIQADYTKTVDEVYHELALRSIETFEDLSILSAVQVVDVPKARKSGLTVHHSLPTWVPCWEPAPKRTPWTMGGRATRNQFDASLARSMDHHFADKNKKLLVLKGLRIDTISAISSTPPVSPFRGDKETTTINFIKATWDHPCGFKSFDSTVQYIDGSGALWAFLDTLSAAQGPVHGKRSSLAERVHGMARYMLRMFGAGEITDPDIIRLAETGNFTLFRRWAGRMLKGRKFAVSMQGYYLLCPANVEEGDVLCVLFGGKTPFLLRSSNHSENYSLVGECYAHGLMNGVAIAMLEKGELEETYLKIE